MVTNQENEKYIIKETSWTLKELESLYNENRIQFSECRRFIKAFTKSKEKEIIDRVKLGSTIFNIIIKKHNGKFIIIDGRLTIRTMLLFIKNKLHDMPDHHKARAYRTHIYMVLV